MHIFKNTNYDFLRWRGTRWCCRGSSSWLGCAVLATRGIPQGVEFSGGTIVIAKFDQLPSIRAGAHRRWTSPFRAAT